MNKENYAPFGEEWKKEVSKLKKAELIELAASIGNDKLALETKTREELPELTESKKAILIIGLLELTVQYTEDLMQSAYFSKLFAQKLKFHANGMIKNYDKVLNTLGSRGNKAQMGDDLVLMATSIENAIRVYVKWD